jgi:hypothetical protein
MQKPLTGKGDIRYWQKRVRKTRSVRGDRAEDAFYSVEFQHGGRRMGFSLGTANQMEAAARAFRYDGPKNRKLTRPRMEVSRGIQIGLFLDGAR